MLALSLMTKKLLVALALIGFLFLAGGIAWIAIPYWKAQPYAALVNVTRDPSLEVNESSPAGNIGLDSYLCSDFLADISATREGDRLLKSMMMIAWATGYAAAQQPETSRADARAVQLIAATLGDTCHRNPKGQVTEVIVDAINGFTSDSRVR